MTSCNRRPPNRSARKLRKHYHVKIWERPAEDDQLVANMPLRDPRASLRLYFYCLAHSLILKRSGMHPARVASSLVTRGKLRAVWGSTSVDCWEASIHVLVEYLNAMIHMAIDVVFEADLFVRSIVQSISYIK